MSNKFKIGDRVRVLKGNGWIDPCIATIANDGNNNIRYLVDIAKEGDEKDFWYIDVDYLEPYIYKVVIGGKLI